MANVLMYSTATCPYCIRARELLDSKEVSYSDIRIDEHPEKREEMRVKSGRHTVPQIFINNVSIGGCDDLYALESQGQLTILLSKGDK
jgi:glutaredoxin 3